MPHAAHRKSIIRKTIQIGTSTMVSRMLGVLREILMVKFLGAGALSDAFWTAFKIPSSLRRIFAEGALSAAFIPAFVKILHSQDRTRANQLMTLSFIVFEGIVLALCALMMWKAALVIYCIAPGFSPEQIALTVPFLRLLMPFIFFVSSSALLAGALQSVEHFFVPAFGPIVLNIAFIIGVLCCLWFQLTASYLCFFILAGGLLQLLQHLHAYYQLHFSFSWWHNDIIKPFWHMLASFFMCSLSMSVMEISLFIDTSFASYLPAGSISLLYYANRFMGIPLGVFASAFSTILLPHFSRLSVYAPKRLNFYLLESTKLIIWVTLPCCFLMMFFAQDIFATLFSKNLQAAQIHEAALILIMFAAGLFFFALNKILLNVYYALRANGIPTAISIISLLFNIIFNVLLIGKFGAVGLALATTLAGVLQTVLLMVFLYKRFQFHFFLRHLGVFMGYYSLQLIALLALFWGVYELIRYVLKSMLPVTLFSFFTTGFGLWIWVGPLCMLLAAAFYMLKNKGGIKLYFLG